MERGEERTDAEWKRGGETWIAEEKREGRGQERLGQERSDETRGETRCSRERKGRGKERKKNEDRRDSKRREGWELVDTTTRERSSKQRDQ